MCWMLMQRGGAKDKALSNCYNSSDRVLLPIFPAEDKVMARTICGLSNATVSSVYEYLNEYSTAGRIEIGHKAVADMFPDVNNDYYGKYRTVAISQGDVHLTLDKEQSVVYVEEFFDNLEVGLGMFWMLDCTDIPNELDDIVDGYDGSMDR